MKFTHTHTHRLSAVVIFFLEATVLGHCLERVSFLLVINKYIKNWMRAALYIWYTHMYIIITTHCHVVYVCS